MNNKTILFNICLMNSNDVQTSIPRKLVVYEIKIAKYMASEVGIKWGILNRRSKALY